MTCNLTAEVREKCHEHGYIHGRLGKDHAWGAEPLPPQYARGLNAIRKPRPAKKRLAR
jgi:hypothetical protein